MFSAARLFQRSSLMARRLQSTSPYSTSVGATWSNSSSEAKANNSSMTTPMSAASTMWWSSIVSSSLLLNNGIMDSIWNMSSTLKKRRAKMNKHKLNKRRKKMRLKSK